MKYFVKLRIGIVLVYLSQMKIMKEIVFILIIVFSFAGSSLFAAPELISTRIEAGVNPVVTEQPSNEIIVAIKKGDSAAVAKFFDSRIDVHILDEKGTYSKEQAEQMLKSFFSKNKVSDFKVVHSVDSPDGTSSSIVGQLGAAGKSYRMYIVFSTSGTSQKIQELNIKDK